MIKLMYPGGNLLEVNHNYTNNSYDIISPVYPYFGYQASINTYGSTGYSTYKALNKNYGFLYQSTKSIAAQSCTISNLCVPIIENDNSNTLNFSINNIAFSIKISAPKFFMLKISTNGMFTDNDIILFALFLYDNINNAHIRLMKDVSINDSFSVSNMTGDFCKNNNRNDKIYNTNGKSYYAKGTFANISSNTATTGLCGFSYTITGNTQCLRIGSATLYQYEGFRQNKIWDTTKTFNRFYIKFENTNSGGDAYRKMYAQLPIKCTYYESNKKQEITLKPDMGYWYTEVTKPNGLTSLKLSDNTTIFKAFEFN